MIDLHEDLMLHIRARDIFKDTWQTSYEQLERNNVKILLSTAFPLPKDENFFNPSVNNLITEDFQAYITYTQKNPDWSIIRTADDLKRVLATKDRRGFILHIEGMNVFDDMPASWQQLESWYDMGWRSLGIVWNLANPLGGGAKDPSKGLTDLGTKVIEWLHEKKMIIDFAHMNSATFWDAAKIVKKPILISHGNTCHECDVPRNYSDEQLKKVAETGGTIGVFFSKPYVTKDPVGEIRHVVAHMEHIRKTIGINHLSFGTDFGGITLGTVKNLGSLDELGNLCNALKEINYTEEMFEKILWRNAARVLESHLG